MRKVYDSRGRHSQSVVFFRRVAPAAIRAAADLRPDLPGLGRLAIARAAWHWW